MPFGCVCPELLSQYALVESLPRRQCQSTAGVLCDPGGGGGVADNTGYAE